MIPTFDPATGNLPPGTHPASWDEVVERFGRNPYRLRLLDGLRAALNELRRFGCRRFYLNGSFVTAKAVPGDWDGRWEVEGVDIHRLALEAPLLWDDRLGRPNQKAEVGGDVFPIRIAGSADDRVILEQFQTDRATGRPKGIVELDLETLS